MTMPFSPAQVLVVAALAAVVVALDSPQIVSTVARFAGRMVTRVRWYRDSYSAVLTAQFWWMAAMIIRNRASALRWRVLRRVHGARGERLRALSSKGERRPDQ